VQQRFGIWRNRQIFTAAEASPTFKGKQQFPTAAE
jgi:hypothetical protein